ncbi:MAG: hypothetical protein HDS66_09385 [Bacteroidales bacterium]|nr:hypothetical protein [Bacteroidales bacterium]
MSNMLSYFPDFTLDNSLFYKMIAFGAPWNAQQAMSMDIAYFTMWAGIATPSHFTTYNSLNGIAKSNLISKTLWDLYGKNWTRLWDAYNTEYNPIENYNLVETVGRTQTDNRSIDKSGTLDSTVDGTDKQDSKEIVDGTVTVNGGSNTTVDSSGSSNEVDDSNGTTTLQHGEKITTNSETDDYTYGFNDVNKVPTSVTIQEGTEDHSGTDVTTTESHGTKDITTTEKTTTGVTQNSSTDTDTTTTGTFNSTTKDVRSDTTSEKTTDDTSIKEDIVRNRSGNIGQHTYQELLQQEFDLWKWSFFKQVFADVDELLILKVYDPCQFS